ncbi:MAG: mannonate dehydratase [Rhodothermales bacterium]|nr:mannonate dehydratase [Rhodothermales bacterium]
MRLSLRWYGTEDPVTLRHIRQIPGVEGIVGSCFDMPVGQPWPSDRVQALCDEAAAEDLSVVAIESIPVHEDIKRGLPTRDAYIEAFGRSLEAVSECGVPVVCYNFMPAFDWIRTDVAFRLPDGSTTMSYDHGDLHSTDLTRLSRTLPAWVSSYSADELVAVQAAYENVSAGMLWDNLAYFLENVVPVAASVGVRLALHPDDPPWPVFGLPRIVADPMALERVCDLVDDPANGVTYCTGSLGAQPDSDLVAGVMSLGARGRIHFVHARNVKTTGQQVFWETEHPSRFGDVDMRAVMKALQATAFSGPLRPDHGRMIWGETGRPGYGLNDRALGAMYLQGLWEGLG